MNPTTADIDDVLNPAYAEAFKGLLNTLHTNIIAGLPDAEDRFRRGLATLNQAHAIAEKVMMENGEKKTVFGDM